MRSSGAVAVFATAPANAPATICRTMSVCADGGAGVAAVAMKIGSSCLRAPGGYSYQHLKVIVFKNKGYGRDLPLSSLRSVATRKVPSWCARSVVQPSLLNAS